mgnify:CR=1 FL=1
MTATLALWVSACETATVARPRFDPGVPECACCGEMTYVRDIEVSE